MFHLCASNHEETWEKKRQWPMATACGSQYSQLITAGRIHDSLADTALADGQFHFGWKQWAESAAPGVHRVGQGWTVQRRTLGTESFAVFDH